MRSTYRWRLLAALVVVASSTLVPGAISAVDLPRSAVPDVSVLVRMPQAKPASALPPRAAAPTAHEPAEVATPRAAPGTAPPSTDDAQVLQAAAAAKPDYDPADLVREMHILYARGPSPDNSSDAKPCPNSTTCERYQLRPQRWPSDENGRVVIPFAYNDSGRRHLRAPDGITRPALQAAAAEWSRWNSRVEFRDMGTTTAVFGADGEDGSCADGTNVVTWRNFDPSVIGAAVLCFDRKNGLIRDADLALNAAQRWERVSGEAQSRHSHDIQSILAHELGHWLALEDLYSADAARQTMSGATSYGETRKRTLALGDVLGLHEAYPCGPGDTCLRTGIVDD